MSQGVRYTDLALAVLQVVRDARSAFEQSGVNTGTVQDTLLLVVGLRREEGTLGTVQNNLIDRFLKRKDIDTRISKRNVVDYLRSLRSRLEKWSRDQNKTKQRRLERLLAGSPTSSAANQAAQSSNIRDSIQRVIKELEKLKFEENQTGQLQKELNVLKLLSSKTTALLGSIPLTEMGSFGGVLAQILKEETRNVTERVDFLERRRRSLTIELNKIRERNLLIDDGFDTVIGGKYSLLVVLDLLIFLTDQIEYNCGECIFFQNNVCTFSGENRPTTSTKSCLDIWNLVQNDFWTANDETIEKAEQKII